ncbi:E3 ubiquitin-protein ligase RNF14-like isoform X1 [Diprion similis]|uniref:E3 ubiquitin-protein ligase RNF14-like isoform X1 n=1 Tax=Diprion similis TaxID=362088 RepID=UPI001EF820BE|nr:E3 ubiquitin-protein ligase RNF14-like isoform X1 [Diprion similis]
MAADKDRREDEIASLAEIYEAEEFSCIKKEDSDSAVECRLSGLFSLPEKLLKVKYLNLNLQRKCPSLPYLKFFVRHLPPANLFVTFPSNYPSENSPSFRISVSWLPIWETSRICQKLDELWLENKGNEILFIWMNFLKFELLSFLDIRYCLDISLIFTAFEDPEEYLNSDLLDLSDPRAVNDHIFLNPKVYLTKYDVHRHRIHFHSSFYTCKICFNEISGRHCLEMNRCSHIYCKDCMRQYISLKIREGQVNIIFCPEYKCKAEVTPDQIKELVSPEIYEKYEHLLLKVTLDSMSDIIYCPRSSCQYPVTTDGDDTLATCANCFYSFCAFCRKVYHGVAPCTMNSQEQMKLIVEYQTANCEQKKLLEKKYGRKQLQIVVEKHLTNSYLKEYTKPCPNCLAPITKIEGCNKMICGHCQAHFCWLCGKHLTGSNPYEHFDTANNPCYERLFEGMDMTVDIFEDDIEGEEIWEEFPV